jgi:hypothetical protein
MNRINNSNADPLWEQDGVAPQCGVLGLTDQRRAYIPAKYADGKTDVPKGFRESHSVKNYGWIFEIKPGQGDLSKGYVTPR